MPDPKISVLMAVYNGEKSVRKTIASVLNQTYSDFELVIIDDCSTDKTLEIIQSYSDSDPRLVVSTNKTNIGQINSLNLGLGKAKGVYIARTDAGDISLPQRFEKQVAYLEEHPEVVVVGTGAVRYDAEGRVIDVLRMPSDPARMRQMAVVTSPIIHVSVMMRKETIIQADGYHPDYFISADYQLWSKLLQENFQLANIPEVLVGYEVSPKSLGNASKGGILIAEASKIIQSNIAAFARRSVSLKQAEDMYKFFMLDLDMLSRDEIHTTAGLYEDIMAELHVPRRVIHYYLLRKYAMYLARHLYGPRRGSLLQIVLSFLKKSDGLFSWQGIVQDINRKWQGMLWRRSVNLLL